MGNTALRKASSAKQDEFYTQLSDIEKELIYYKEHFVDKTIFMNCDDPEWSNFWKYFYLNFDYFKLKKIISTHYTADLDEPKKAYALEYDGSNTKKTEIEGDGDFRSPAAIEYLKLSDIIITNPPFSLWRTYLEQLVEYKKNFIIIGSQNAYTYKEVFNLIQQNKIWVGNNCGDMSFKVPKHYPTRETRFWIDENGQKWRSLGNIAWFTNLDIAKRHENIVLTKFYENNEELYPRYDNYNAINIDKLTDIPMDYKGYMGVPITFMNKHNPAQFTIYGIMNTGEENKGIRYENTEHGRPVVNGVEKYLRILIKNNAPVSRQEMLGF